MQASIVIRTYNEERYLPYLLDSVKEQSVPAAEREVILVDSGSTDRTVAIAEQHGCRIVRIKPEEFSFGRSLNLGCEAARGKNLIFISGHCIPASKTWLEELIRPLGQEKCAITYGRQEGGEDTKFSERQIFLKYFPPTNEPPASEFFCNNANAAVTRDLWQQLRFDEILTGLEDMEIGRRAVAAGFRVQYVSAASIYHLHHETWLKIKRRYEREAIALQKIMPEVHIGLADAGRYFITAVFNDWARAVTQKCFVRSAFGVVLFRFFQYYGSWRGNHHHRQLSRRAKEKYFYPR